MTKVSLGYVKRMEQILAASSAKLIDSLDYSSLPGVADYIQSRSQIQIFPEGG